MDGLKLKKKALKMVLVQEKPHSSQWNYGAELFKIVDFTISLSAQSLLGFPFSYFVEIR